MRGGQLSHHGQHKRLQDEVRLEQVRHGKVQLKVGAANPQLGHDPVLGHVARRPDRVVRPRRLMELDGDGNEVASRVADDEQDERRGDEALVGVAVNGRNVGQKTVVGYVQLAVL